LKTTVVISTRNRKEELSTALTSCLAQTARPEIIVLSDGSTDGTGDMVREKFPTVSLREFRNSIGPAARRNLGIELATGDVIVILDDDIAFPSPATIEQTLREFDNPIIGALTIPFVNIRKDADHIHQRAPDATGVYVTDAFVACACALRRDVLVQVGMFRPDTIMYGEEEDLSIRMLNRGFLIRLGSAHPLHHYESPRRSSKRMDLLGARNKLLFSWLNVPLPYLLIHFPGTVVHRVAFGIRKHAILNALEGLAWGVGSVARQLFRRAPVERATYRLFRLLRRRQALRIEELPREWQERWRTIRETPPAAALSQLSR